MTRDELHALIDENFVEGKPYQASLAQRLTTVFDAIIDDFAVLRVEGASPNADSITLTASDGAADDGDGGNVTIGPGLAEGSGTDGNLILTNIPVADPLVAGAVWADTGVLTISAGA